MKSIEIRLEESQGYFRERAARKDPRLIAADAQAIKDAALEYDAIHAAWLNSQEHADLRRAIEERIDILAHSGLVRGPLEMWRTFSDRFFAKR